MRALIFGFGYVGEAVAQALLARGWQAAATARTPEQAARQTDLGVEPVPLDRLHAAMAKTQAILVTAPPGPAGCPALLPLTQAIATAAAFPDWIGYLSTTGVYGDREGRWVDERSPLAAHSTEGGRRVAAERDWRQSGRGMGLTVTTFRLPGIYGPGRSAFDRLRDGTALRIEKPGHVFSRIHRDDIVSAVLASIERPRAGAVYNIVDDEPAPGEVVVEHAARLMGIDPPPLTQDIPPRSARFYGENKRVANALAKAELGWRPKYPDYREGLAAIWAATSSTAPINRAIS